MPRDGRGLFFQAEELARLREAIQTTHREEWEQLKASVDARARRGRRRRTAPIEGDPTRPGTPNDEMLWQRVFGYRVPAAGPGGPARPRPEVLRGHARKWALKPGEYPLWGAGIFEGTDLAAGHELYGIWRSPTTGSTTAGRRRTGSG